MFVQEKSPEFPPFNFESTGHALRRHFAILDITYVDCEIGIDMLRILAFLNQRGVSYADAWGQRRSMEAAFEKWRIVD